MLTAIEAADIIILAFPLYVDSLPYGCMRAFEIIAEKYHNAAKNGQRMIAICNSGFPEASSERDRPGYLQAFRRRSGLRVDGRTRTKAEEQGWTASLWIKLEEWFAP